MIRHLVTFFCLIVSLDCFSQGKDSIFIDYKQLDLFIKTEFDTIKLGSPIIITVKIKNISNQDISLPMETNYSSNIFPNGLDQVFSGFNIHFDILPLKDFSSIYIEDLVVCKPKDFKKISPNEIMVIKYDFGKHINIANSASDNNPRTIDPNKTYSIAATLISNVIDESDKKSFVGRIVSNKIQIYLIE